MRRQVLRNGLAWVVLASGVACEGPRPLGPASPSEGPTPAGGPATGSPCALAVTSFSVVEFQYPWSTDWNYAPVTRVACPAGTSGAEITRVAFTLPGYPAFPPSCTLLRVPDGEEVNLFGMVYGDYDLTIGGSGVRLSGGGDAAVTISFRDGTGAEASVTARGPIVIGDLPETPGGAWRGHRCPSSP